MKKLIDIYPLALLLLMMAGGVGCSQKVTSDTTISHQRFDSTSQVLVKHDSIVFRDIVKVDTIRIPGATVTQVIKLDCDSSGIVQAIDQAYYEGRASVKVSIKDGRLTVIASCDSLEKLVLSRTTELTTLKELMNSSRTSVGDSTALTTSFTKVTGLNVPWPYKLAAWLAGGYLLLTIIWILWKVGRTYLKLQTGI